jgi:capsular exopolysaccharide synthesis family protein
MSKFFKALEQASRDRALRPVPPAEPVRPAEAAPGPEADQPLDGVDEHLVSLLTPAAFEAEQYRALRHTVEQLHQTAGVKVVAVSSPTVGDGKTITAVNLAGALAQGAGMQVLVVDADLRHAALSRLLGIGGRDGAGLVDGILDAGLTLDRIAQPRPPFNLSVIRAGQMPPNPYEVLRSPRLGALLEEARGRYDYVVLDTPPLVPVQDCRVIAHWVDGFLLVVAAHRTPRRLVEEALTTLDPAKVLGIVFNQDDRSIAHHYSGYYGYPDPGRPAPDGSVDGALRQAVRTVGDSLRPLRRTPRGVR